jgi:hypothetical protein
MGRLKPVVATSLLVPRPRHGAWYRIGMIADYRSGSSSGDLMLLSRAVRVRAH